MSLFSKNFFKYEQKVYNIDKSIYKMIHVNKEIVFNVKLIGRLIMVYPIFLKILILIKS